MCDPSAEWCSGCWLTISLACYTMQYMTIVAQDVTLRTMQHEPKQILTWSTDSRSLGEIWKLESPYLPVSSILSLISVNMDENRMRNTNFLCTVTIVIPRLPCLFSMAKAVSLTVELVNWLNSDSVNLFNFAMCAFASRCFLIEVVPCSDGWWKPWWQMIHMMQGLPVASIPQGK